MDVEFYKRVERGRIMKLQTLARVLRALEVRAGDFLTLRDPGHVPTRGRPPRKRGP